VVVVVVVEDVMAMVVVMVTFCHTETYLLVLLSGLISPWRELTAMANVALISSRMSVFVCVWGVGGERVLGLGGGGGK
jgi:hypothetical protein